MEVCVCSSVPALSASQEPGEKRAPQWTYGVGVGRWGSAWGHAPPPQG